MEDDETPLPGDWWPTRPALAAGRLENHESHIPASHARDGAGGPGTRPREAQLAR